MVTACQDVNAESYPIVFPRTDHVTRLIIWQYHKLNGQQVLATTRDNTMLLTVRVR